MEDSEISLAGNISRKPLPEEFLERSHGFEDSVGSHSVELSDSSRDESVSSMESLITYSGVGTPPPLLNYVPMENCLCCAITSKKSMSEVENIALVPENNDTISPTEKAWTATFVENLIQQLRRRELRGSHQAARRTAEVLRNVVEIHPWQTSQQLVEVVSHVGKRLIRAAPMEFLVANVVRRVLCIVRMEHYKHFDTARHRSNMSSRLSSPTKSSQNNRNFCVSSRNDARGSRSSQEKKLQWNSERAAPSMSMYFDPYAAADAKDLLMPVPYTVKQSIFEGISELLAEIDSAWEDGEEIRMACFHDGDCILTYGYSLAVIRLLKALHNKAMKQQASSYNPRRSTNNTALMMCRFEVIVLGGDAEDGGRKMTRILLEYGIKTTFVPDGGLFTVLKKVDKVLLGTVAVLSSGGAITVSGANHVARAAKIFNRPVLIVAPLFKLTYLPFFDHHSRNEFLPPAFMLENCNELGDVDIQIPLYDYIPVNLLTVFITDVGPIDPSYLFTLSKQRYHIEDLALCVLD